MDRLPPFQYALNAPSPHLTREEISRLVCQDLIQLDTKRTWMPSTTKLGTKMVTEDGFVERPSYMDSHLSHGLRCVIGQMRTSPHQLEIETGRFRGIPAKDRTCQLCHREPETELHFICHCPVYYEIRGRYHCLFRDRFGPLSKVMSFPDQCCLGLYLLEAREYRESILRRSKDT